MLDLVVENGRLVDETGNSWFVGEVGIEDGTRVEVGRISHRLGKPSRSVEKPHPRLYGTFPHVLARYVGEKALLSLERSIRKMTSFLWRGRIEAPLPRGKEQRPGCRNRSNGA